MSRTRQCESFALSARHVTIVEQALSAAAESMDWLVQGSLVRGSSLLVRSVPDGDFLTMGDKVMAVS